VSENLISFIVLLAPVLMVVTAIVSWFQPGIRPKSVIRLGLASALLGILVVGWSSYFVYQNGLIESAFLGFNDFGLSIRLDSLSMLMLGMISLLSFIIIKFSVNYLDGDTKQGAFIGRLAACLASVQLLVLAGNLGLLFIAWMLTSISLHRLLVFYRERPGAHIAARKKFILARLGDIILLAAVGLLYHQFGSGNLEVIFKEVRTAPNLPFLAVEAPALLLAVAAILKSAQFPTHGWLIEVMETPTPVSALLHAGLLNAGPFLVIRMAFVVDASVIAPILLMLVGGITALFASVAFLTQTSIKTALGYSSVAHMGFSLMVCGLGVFPAAMLHLVAHSFYKAHAFLSSGSVVDKVRAAKVIKVANTVSPLKTIIGIVVALGLYTGFAVLWGIDPYEEFSLLILGAVIVLGLSRLLTLFFNGKWNLQIIAQGAVMALLVCVAFFTLESATHSLLAYQVPELSMPVTSKVITASFILLAFSSAVFIQIISPRLANSAFYRQWAIHFRNGLYANALFDRLVGALQVHTPESRLLNSYLSEQNEKLAADKQQALEKEWLKREPSFSAKN